MQPEKAPALILVTLSGMVMDVGRSIAGGCHIDVGDAVWDVDGCQRGALLESDYRYGDAVWYDDGVSGTVVEGVFTDVGDAVADGGIGEDAGEKA